MVDGSRSVGLSLQPPGWRGWGVEVAFLLPVGNGAWIFEESFKKRLLENNYFP